MTINAICSSQIPWRFESYGGRRILKPMRDGPDALMGVCVSECTGSRVLNILRHFVLCGCSLCTMCLLSEGDDVCTAML